MGWTASVPVPVLHPWWGCQDLWGGQRGLRAGIRGDLATQGTLGSARK